MDNFVSGSKETTTNLFQIYVAIIQKKITRVRICIWWYR